MENCIKISVLDVKQSEAKELYRNSIFYDDSVKIDFDKIIYVLSLLYPKSLIQFSVIR